MRLALEIALAAALLTTLTVLLRRWARLRGLEQSPRRILFPFVGRELSGQALDACIRLCRAEQATLVPAALTTVPLALALDSPQPRQAGMAMPVLEAIELRSLAAGVPVDSRIERGRSPRHALRELAEHERFDRIVVAADSTGDGLGLGADDIAWMLEEIPGEIVILRPGDTESSQSPAPPYSGR